MSVAEPIIKEVPELLVVSKHEKGTYEETIEEAIEKDKEKSADIEVVILISGGLFCPMTNSSPMGLSL